MHDDKRPMLDFGERLALYGVVAGLVGTVAAMALPFAYPNLPVWAWKLIFWPSVSLVIIAMIFLIGDVVLRSRAGTIWSVAKRKMAILLFAGIAIVCILGSGLWYLTRPVASPSLDGPILSRANKYIFSCPKLITANTQAWSRGEALERIRQILRARGATFGFQATADEIPDGLRIEVTPVTPQMRLSLNGVTKFIIEVRTAGPDVLITTALVNPAPLDLLFSLVPVDPKAPLTIKLTEMMEDMVGAQRGACHVA